MLTYDEARYLLSLHLMELEAELSKEYTTRRFQTIKALEMVLDKLDRELASYRNYP